MGQDGIKVTFAPEPEESKPMMVLELQPITIVITLLAMNFGVMLAFAIWFVANH